MEIVKHTVNANNKNSITIISMIKSLDKNIKRMMIIINITLICNFFYI